MPYRGLYQDLFLNKNSFYFCFLGFLDFLFERGFLSFCLHSYVHALPFRTSSASSLSLTEVNTNLMVSNLALKICIKKIPCTYLLAKSRQHFK
jgi:hypothetical protein